MGEWVRGGAVAKFGVDTNLVSVRAEWFLAAVCFAR
jgi:hypothetical protein